MVSIHTLVLALILVTPAFAQVNICPSTTASESLTKSGPTRVQPIASTWGATYTVQCKATVIVKGGRSNSGVGRV